MAVAIPVAMALIAAGMKPAGKGLMLGALFSVLNFVLMGQSLPRQLGKTRKAAAAFSFGALGFRYLVLAIPLILAVRYDAFHPAATVAGLFMIQVVILADHVLRALRGRNEKRV